MAQKVFDIVYAVILIAATGWIASIMIELMAERGYLDEVTLIGVLGGAVLGAWSMWKARIRFD
ncbi:hypothetical protein [Roseobacter weihaiensis]|uniref:hypothetical protein n=1 Tax=Roseobacter weihaiensis TaxID=2763262 RepID=UPI001D0A5797|nr:hypothetical protein [Roseobacter sp. H9]